MNYTVSDYLDTITRELQKRATTYPKIIAKKIKQGVDQDNINTIIHQQTIQVSRLEWIKTVIREIDTLDNQSALCYMEELNRELKMRKKYYLRLIYFKRITPEVAKYEIDVWAALTNFFYEKYLIKFIYLLLRNL